MISYLNRFHGHGSLRYVYKNGKAFRSRLFTIKLVENSRRKHSRVAVVVSKKVHKSAVGRNRIRRRLYELIRLRLSKVTKPHDIVIIVSSSEIITMPHKELTGQFESLLSQTSLLG